MKAQTLILASLVVFSFTGFATAEENAEGKKCKKACRLSPEKKEELLKLYDADGDGKLDEEERKKARESRRQEILEKYDSDNDGELSKEEKHAMVLDRFDADRDGTLNDEEKAKAKAAKKARHCKKGKKRKPRGKHKEPE